MTVCVGNLRWLPQKYVCVYVGVNLGNYVLGLIG